MFIPDKSFRTIRLQVTVDDSRCTARDGGPLPKLRNGTRAELIVSAGDLIDDEELEPLIRERDIQFLPRGTRLWARVKEDEIPEKLLLHRAEMKVYPVIPERVVAFELLGDLGLIIRANKRSVLADCDCHIPSLGIDASSVNEAYTRISTAFEPSRRSHVGNVFNCVFVESKDGLRPLADLRIAKESEPI